MNKYDPWSNRYLIFAAIVKEVKKTLPKACSFLSPLKTTKGEFQVRAVINGDEYKFTVPEKLDFTNADIQQLHSVILEKC